jgi:hypothetical protein
MVNSSAGIAEGIHPKIQSRLALSILLCLHAVICCASLVQASHYQSYMPYDGDRLYYAIAAVAAFSIISSLFVLARFSFGYFAGFYFYTMVLGFLWLSCFTKYNYDQKLAGVSAAASMLLFLLPALFINAPLKRVFTLSSQNFERVLRFILVLAVVTIAVASTYNFRIVSLDRIYDFRDALGFPTILRYLIGIVSSALLPFAFAGYWALGYRWSAGLALLLMLLFYPITLSKLALFAPTWIVMLLVLSRIFETRIATVLSLLLPLFVGVVLIAILPAANHPIAYFDKVNIRMMATPSSAMDIYNDFFSSHPHTHFCQISFLKPLMQCPYQEQLSVAMEKAYGFGNLNASLFATEGIASVGLVLAPLAALVCGLVFALGNQLSAGLPPRFILISGALLPQILLNVPLTTVLVTHGAGILFLLWYLTPRSIFDGNGRTNMFASGEPESAGSATTVDPAATVNGLYT